MKFLICLFLLLAFLLPAPAQQSPVPIEKEPRHPLIFENQYVRVFDVLIPAGKTTLFHIHKNDSIGVRLTDARIKDKTQGGATEEIIALHDALNQLAVYDERKVRVVEMKFFG